MMKVTCPCNNCSERVEFEEEMAGQSVDCPYCGMETRLFIPKGALARTETPPLVPRIADSAPGEQVIFNGGWLTVTDARFVLGNETFAVSNITSIKPSEQAPSHLASLFVIVVGALVACGGTLPLAVIGLSFVGGGVYIWRREKPQYRVTIMTSAGEERGFSTQDRNFATNAFNALNQAIASRR